MEKMPLETVVGKCRGELAVKINSYFVSAPTLQWPAGRTVQILVLCCWLGGLLLGGWLQGGQVSKHPVLTATLTHALQVGRP